MKVLSSKLLMTLAAFLLMATPTYASGHHFPDWFADFMTWVVMVIVPVVFIWVFLKLHIIPEKVAEKRNHSQKDAIAVMCILSLFLGGMLWPIALIWAYSSPVKFKMERNGKEVARFTPINSDDDEDVIEKINRKADEFKEEHKG